MPRVDVDLVVEIERTPRVMQVEGIFDVPEAKRQTASYHFDAPIEEREWQVGLIVGPSGAGKSSVARHLFGDAIVDGYDWHPTRSIVDGFGGLPIREVTGALSSVGFSSPPSWIKPFHVLSNGEKFRATLARALVDPRPLVVVDEFTSVVDRTVARIGSHAVAKAVRRSPGKRFVAVSCHDDIVEWLQPDWVIEPHVGHFRWRELQRRPSLGLEVVRCDASAWRWFAPHHYLSSSLHRAARCWAALVDGAPAGFVAVLPFPHPKRADMSRVHRIVVLPDYQGIGLSSRLLDMVGSRYARDRRELRIATSHPALIQSLARSSTWALCQKPSIQSRSKGRLAATTSVTRRVATFRYCGGAALYESCPA